jgi:O-acetyl-ADP-ribose deacetylase (regulator of RNase III)
MGKGIATEFKQRFNGVDELRRQNVQVGGVAVLADEGRYIYYLVTKERYFRKPTLESLRSSLMQMKSHCIENGVTRLSMPRIGCGLDKLQWNDVSKIIDEVFAGANVSITVYRL